MMIATQHCRLLAPLSRLNCISEKKRKYNGVKEHFAGAWIVKSGLICDSDYGYALFTTDHQ